MSASRIVSWEPPSSFDEYKLVKQLGRGRTGLVYVAHDTLLERHVAVKFIPARDEALLARFLIEARAAARIQHPNVATLYRVGRLDGQAYLVWELVRGKSLDQFARPVAPDEVIRIALDVVRGLGAAHRRGVLHRDIKPGNIVVADSGEAKLVDFGLAALLDLPATERPEGVVPDAGRAASGDVSASDGTIGTPYFMSPEAWRGDELDARSDLYSLGLVLYELLAGEGPFRHLRVKELAQALQDETPRPLLAAAPTVPAALAQIVDRMLRREREARYQSAADLLAALDVLSPTRAHAAVPEGNPYRGLRTYDAEHRALFFGRTRPLQLALERLRAESLLVVTGDSGVGKSSLCAAGVVPAVAEGALEDGRRWLVARAVPGRTPARNIAAALAHLLGIAADRIEDTFATAPEDLGRVVRAALREELGLLLYLDQFEELVTQHDIGDAAAAVARGVSALADGVPGVRVLATARSDFLSRLAGLPGFAERIPPAILLLGPMSAADVREAIVGPAALKGGRFESDELVDALVASTVEAQGSLPLLQFTLAELWERRDHATGVISEASLAEIGGVSGALARHADEVLLALSPSDRQVAREVLLRLVTVDDTRTRRTNEELRAVAPSAPQVVEALVRGRLLVASETAEGATYEIAHEALVRGWTTLSHWLAEEAELRAARHRLESAAAEWQRLGKTRELLFTARQLDELDPRVLHGLAPRETVFLEQSRRARRVTRWTRRGIVAAVAVAIVGAWQISEALDRRELQRAIARDVASASVTWEAGRDATTQRAVHRRQAFAAWDRKAPEEGERHWKQMQSHAEVAREKLAETSALLERALLRDAERPDVRARYADLLLDRILLADADGRIAERDELANRLALYDTTGERRARLAARAKLIVDVEPQTARLVLARYEPGEQVAVGPGTSVAIAPGAWMLIATAEGHEETRLSIIVERGQQERLAVRLPRTEQVPPGYVYMPTGPGLFGSSDAEAVRSWFNAVPQHVVTTKAYWIARHETTFADWIAFLDELPPDERELRRPRVAGTGFRGSLELAHDPRTGWQIALQPTEHMLRAKWGERVRYPERDRRQEQDWRRMPVSGVSYDDAVAYASWLDRTKRLPGARLCTEHEWERAARGTDDRMFPSGDTLGPDDANVDETYGKKSGGFGPDEVGSHPTGNSPFGISDLSGNVWEWTTSSVVKGQVVARGGSYYFAANTARITNREIPERTYRDLTVGLRICADAQP